MIDASQFPTIIHRTWLDEAETKPVYEAHVLFSSVHIGGCMGQGSTPNRADREAREALALVQEHRKEHGLPELEPFKPGRDAILITFTVDGCIRINHVHPATKRRHA